MLRTLAQAGATILGLLVVAGATGNGALSPKQVHTAPYQFDLLSWEVSHFLDKWWRLVLWSLFGEGVERSTAIDRYFALAEELRLANSQLLSSLVGPGVTTANTSEAQARISAIEAERLQLQPTVEEALEAALSGVIVDQGLTTSIGSFLWPPVDFTFEQGLLVLVTSPRDVVQRLDDIALRPTLDLLTQEELETRVEATEGISSVIVRVGGIATYPAQVSPSASLHSALIIAAHEWIHHYLFFRPLGVRWFEGGELASINETVANMAGREIGDAALTRLTGQVVDRQPYVPPSGAQIDTGPAGVFDYRQEMRTTRLHLDELLAAGHVEEAERYLEVRRLRFVENGIFIRKLNNAWFAFYGSYADSPSAASQIEPQLQAVRAHAGSLAAFLDRISGITDPSDLERLARAAGWEPPE